MGGSQEDQEVVRASSLSPRAERTLLSGIHDGLPSALSDLYGDSRPTPPSRQPEMLGRTNISV